ncbi:MULTISPECIES: DUF6979 family protein [Methylosinus]|uniref:DUF6979 family protein n=1 Tax=Methylosinus TaxID=425 RepID=UPI0012DC3FD8|nr:MULTISPECIES: hypothetical protein [Methylosinus]
MSSANVFGQAACQAATELRLGSQLTPRKVWQQVISRLSEKKSIQDKGCPRGAFLGLCEEGQIQGIPARATGSYTKSKLNKNYAIRAIKILRDNPRLVNDPAILWSKVCGIKKAHNNQMDVVISLWNRGLITK